MTRTRYWGHETIDGLMDEWTKAHLDFADRREVLSQDIIDVMEERLTVLKSAILHMGDCVE